jgi:hypothetical protein
MLMMKYWKYRGEFTGELGRAFDLWRSNPNWYMHPVLVADCIAKQGCCSRGCGCCRIKSKQRDIKQNNSYQKLGVGHCTLACEFCRKAHGFQLSLDENLQIRG